MEWFTTPVVGNASSSVQEAAMRLDESEEEGLEALRTPLRAKGSRLDFQSSANTKGVKGVTFPWQREKLWLSTGNVVGYIAPQAGPRPLAICDPGSIRPDKRLKQAAVKVTLDRLSVESYPGRGIHRVLLHFFAQHQATTCEDLHFNATYRIGEGAHAGVRGFPVFVGLGVGTEGLRLKVRTINVANEQDFAMLNILESHVFQAGLKLVSTAQPALGPLSELAFGVAKTIANRNNNISVQDIDLGLDFQSNPTGARLAEGSYLVAQIPEHADRAWNWEQWVYTQGRIVHRTDPSQAFAYNYLLFAISRCS